jgi:hypothetical protein
MADQEDRSSWTVKSMSIETRKLATARAAKSGETMAQWLDRAIRNQADMEAGTRVIPPPSTPAATGQGRALAVANGHPAPLPSVDLAGLSGMLTAVQSMAEASGVPIPRATTKHALALVRDQLRAARGLPGLPPRSPKPKSGQTVSEEQED